MSEALPSTNILNRKEFYDALKVVKYGIAAKSVIPIFNYIKCAPTTLSAFNGEIGISKTFNTNVSCLLPGETIVKLLDATCATNVEIVTEGNTSIIKSNEAVTKFATPDLTDFIFSLPNPLPDKKITITQEFIEGIKKCLPSISTNPLHEGQNGITFTEEGLFATDRVRIARFLFTEKFPIPIKILLPEAFCKTIISLDLVFPASLYIGADFILLSAESLNIYSKINNEVQFINFEKVIRGIYSPTVTTLPISNEFREAINKCTTLSQKDGVAYIENTAEKIIISLMQEEKGQFHKDELSIKLLTILPQHKYFLEYLKYGVENTTLFTFVQGKNDMIFIGKAGNYLYLLSSYPIK